MEITPNCTVRRGTRSTIQAASRMNPSRLRPRARAGSDAAKNSYARSVSVVPPPGTAKSRTRKLATPTPARSAMGIEPNSSGTPHRRIDAVRHVGLGACGNVRIERAGGERLDGRDARDVPALAGLPAGRPRGRRQHPGRQHENPERGR